MNFGAVINLSVPLVLLVLLVDTGDGKKAENLQSGQEQQLHPPTFFHIKNAPKGGRSCGKYSPGIFLDNIAIPSLSLLYHRGQAFFGILMDKIEASYNASASDFKEAQSLNNETREEWAYMAKVVSKSWDNTIDRLETEWEYFVLIHDMEDLLPWERRYRLPIIHEMLSRLEYGYLMVDVVAQSGIKEILGILQHQLGGVIRKLEEEVAKISNKDDDVTPEKLHKQMQKGFSKMKPSFCTKLMEKIISKSLTDSAQKRPSTFISEPLDQMAIVLHAFREKGISHPYFWADITRVFEKEFGFSIKSDEGELMSKFVQELNKDQDKLIDLIVQIFSKESRRS